MNLESLKIFCDVVREQSFSRAAAANGVTQSAASQTVNQLEKRLGVTLIDRSKRPLSWTREGKLYFEGCSELLDGYSVLEDRIRKGHTKSNGLVRVAAIYSVGLHQLKVYNDRLQQVTPGVRVRLACQHPEEVYRSVQDETADLGMVSFPRGAQFVVVPWRDEPMVLVCPRGHGLAERSTVLPAELAGESFVGFETGLTIRRKVDKYLRKHQAIVKEVMEFDNIENIKRAVEAGAGLSILPAPAVEREVQQGTLRTVRLAGDEFVRPVGIIYRKGKRLSAAAAKYLELLQDGAREMNGTLARP